MVLRRGDSSRLNLIIIFKKARKTRIIIGRENSEDDTHLEVHALVGIQFKIQWNLQLV